MANTKLTGTEKNNNNLTGVGVALQIDGVNITYTAANDGVLTVRVQLGNAAAPLQSGERIKVSVSITSAVTGDKMLMPQFFVDVPAGKTVIGIVSEPYTVRTGDIIEVVASSNNALDIAVGSCVESLLIGY
jgi:hypothetical protein